MAFLPALISVASRFVGRVMSSTLGWASTMLFGRVPASRQGVVVGIAFAAVLWAAMVVGVLSPGVGTFLIALVPRPPFLGSGVLRIGMLVGAIVVPGVVGLATAWLAGARRTPAALAREIVRGYPLTAVMALTLVFLAALAVVRKTRSLASSWSDEHIAIVVEPDGYDQVVADLAEVLRQAGVPVRVRPAPATLAVPARLLARVAGPNAEGLVPHRLMELGGPDLRILVYPSDVMISGTREVAARARAAVSSRLTTSAAHLTTSADAQEVEDRIRALGELGTATDPLVPARLSAAAAAQLRAIDRELEGRPIERGDWEVLYRERLQVERDLRAGGRPREMVLAPGEGMGAAAPSSPGRPRP